MGAQVELFDEPEGTVSRRPQVDRDDHVLVSHRIFLAFEWWLFVLEDECLSTAGLAVREKSLYLPASMNGPSKDRLAVAPRPLVDPVLIDEAL